MTYPADEIVLKLRQLYMWPAPHGASLIEELQAEIASLNENTQTCGWCGHRLFRVTINKKKSWAHESVDSCTLLDTK